MADDAIRPSTGLPPIGIRQRDALVFVTYNSGATDQEYEQYLEKMTRLLFELVKTRTAFGQVHDATRWSRSTARQRKLQADWIQEHNTLLSRHCAACGFVMTSTFVRGGLTAVLWLSGFPMPYKVFATPPDAEMWVQERVDHAERMRLGPA